jgi:symplekin
VHRNPENQINGRIQQYLERMHRTRLEIFDEANRKRPAPSEPTNGLDQAKRQRVVAEAPIQAQPIPPLPAGDVSWRQLYTLNPEGSTVNFDVQAFKDPEQLLRIVVPVLQSVDAQKLDHAINVREIHLSLLLPQTLPQPTPGGIRLDVMSSHVGAQWATAPREKWPS